MFLFVVYAVKKQPPSRKEKFQKLENISTSKWRWHLFWKCLEKFWHTPQILKSRVSDFLSLGLEFSTRSRPWSLGLDYIAA